MNFKVDKLRAPQALRVWTAEKNIPEATKYLLRVCSKLDITLSVITLEIVGDEWAIIAWGD